MAQVDRPGLTAEQKREMWSRWKAGQSLHHAPAERMLDAGEDVVLRRDAGVEAAQVTEGGPVGP